MSDDAGEIDLGFEVTKGVVAKFVQAILGFGGILIFARELDKVGLGGFYLLLSLVHIVDKSIVGGWSNASKKRFSEHDTDREKIIGTQIIFSLVMVGVVVVLLLIFSGWLESYTGIPDAWFYFLVLIAPMSMFHPFQGMVAARGKVGVAVWADALRSVITTPLQVGLVLLGMGAIGMVWGLGIATILTIPVTFYYLATRVSFPDRETIKDIWQFAKHSIPTSIIGNAYGRYDILLLGAVVGQSSVANYEVAFKLTLPAIFVAGVAGSALMPKVSNLTSKNEAVHRDITNALAFTSILAIPIFFGALAMPESLLVTAYGPKYHDAGLFLVGLALYRTLTTQTLPLQQALDGLDRPDLNFRISGVTLVLNIVLGLVLVYKFGAIGVVVATIVAETLRYGLLCYVMRRTLDGIDLFPVPLWEQITAGFLMFFVVLTLSNAILLKTFFHVGLVVGIGGLVYGIVLLTFSVQFRRLMGKVAIATHKFSMGYT